MSTRIDHFADAEKNLLTIGETLSAETNLQMPFDEMIAIAQLQATLALVEQQRATNLVAVAGWLIDAGPKQLWRTLDELGAGGADAVREALGLA